MADLVLDVGPLADLLSQYFQAEDRLSPKFCPSRYLSEQSVRRLNAITRGNGPFIVATSAMTFVELARKWDDIVADRFTPQQLAAFVRTPPDWFTIEPVDRDLIRFLGQIPPDVQMPDGTRKPIEWPDAVHMATALSRETAELVTSDGRLLQLAAILTKTGGFAHAPESR